MRKFTKLLFTMLLLCAVGIVNAAEEVLLEKDYSKDSSLGWTGTLPDGCSWAWENGALKIVNPTALTDSWWSLQGQAASGLTLEEGKDYIVRLTLKATGEGIVTMTLGSWSNNVGKNLNLSTTSGFETVDFEYPAYAYAVSGGHALFQPGRFAGTIEIQKVQLINPSAKDISWLNLVKNGYCESDDATSFMGKDGGTGKFSTNFVDGTGVSASRAVVVKSLADAVNSHDTQFFITTPHAFKAGEKFKVKFSYRADKAASAETQAHKIPGEYLYWQLLGNISFTTEWQTLERTVVVSDAQAGMQSIAFNLNVDKSANTYYFDNISLSIDRDDATSADLAFAKTISEETTDADNPDADPLLVAAAKDRLQTYIDAAEALDTESLTAEQQTYLKMHLDAAKALVNKQSATVSWCNIQADRLAAYTGNLDPETPDTTEPFDPVDLTSKVSTDDWLSDIGNVGNYTKDVAQKEQYLENTTTQGKVLYQSVKGLPSGTYTVELYANASYTAGRGFDSDAADGDLGRVVVYAGGVEGTIPVVYQTAVGTNNIVKLENVAVSNGVLELGMRKDLAGSNWHTIQIKSLTQVSNQVAPDVAAQNTYWQDIATQVADLTAYAVVTGQERKALTQAVQVRDVQKAIAAFYAAKSSYQALADAIAAAEAAEGDIDVTAAKALQANEDATAVQADMLAEQLNEQVNPTEDDPVVSTVEEAKKALQEAIDAAEALDTEGKPAERVADLKLAIDAAKALLAKPDTAVTVEWCQTQQQRVETAAANLDKAEVAIEPSIEEGTYYLYNVAADGYVVGGNNWGTRASISKEGGIAVTAVLQPNGRYELQTSPTYQNLHIGFNGYVDNGEGSQYWVIEPVEGQEGVYTLGTGSGTYLFWDGGTATTTTVGTPGTAENGYWKFVTAEEREALFETASESNPADATFLIVNPNFSRVANTSVWNVVAAHQNLAGGPNENTCAESWRSAFTLTQTINNVPDGKYIVKAQAALTDYANAYDGVNYPVVFAGDQTTPFKEMDTADRGTDMTQLSNAFTAGNYEVDPITVETVSGSLTIGVRGTRTDTWCIWDNFRLYYVGPASAALYAPAYANAVAEAQSLLNEEMSASAKAKLEEAIAADVDTDDTEAVQAAIKQLNAAIAAAKASIASTAALAAGVPDNSLDGWTCTTGNTFHINTWSVEGNSDGTNMKTPFIENWVSKPGPLNSGTIYKTMTGLEPGYYDVTALVRIYSESGASPSGGSFFANDASVDITTGKSFDYNGMKGIYDNYMAVGRVDESGVLTFGVNVVSPTYNWVAIKNIRVSYIGDNGALVAKRELIKVINDAKALVGTAYSASVKNALQSAIDAAELVNAGAAFTATDVRNEIVDLKAAIAKFENDNIPPRYYVQNIATGKWLGAGNDWGTRASLVEHPEYLVINEQSDGTYTIESQVSNGGTAYYFGGDYMDSTPAANVTIEHVDDYSLISLNGAYYGYDGTSTVLGKDLTADDENARWKIYNINEMAEKLAAATVTNPVDATYLILNPNFGRNNRNSGAWTMDAGNSNMSGGADNNRCAESWRSAFTLAQKLNVPNGVYALGVQAALTDYADLYDGSQYPVAYANDATSPFVNMEPADRGSNMTQLSNAFSAGKYAVEPVIVTVTDGTLTIGVKGTRTDTWCIWDNFSLTYYGAGASPEAIKNSAVIKAYEDALAAAKAAAEKRMAASYLKDLKAAIDENSGVDQADADALTAATKALNAAVAVAQKSIDSYTYLSQGYMPDDAIAYWTCSNSQAFHVNTWSVEGNEGNDPTGFTTPFIENWVGKPGPLDDGQILCTLPGIDAGTTVTVSVDIRIYSESGENPAGAEFFSGRDRKSIEREGAFFEYNGMQGVYGTFTAKATVGADGTLQFGVEITNPTFNWVAVKNVKFTDFVDAIEAIGTQKTAVEGQVYNLQGQKVSNAKKGLYIIGGRKVVLK